MSSEMRAIVEPFLEDRIRHLRLVGSMMVSTLDQRMKRQRRIVEDILERRGVTAEELMEMGTDRLEGDSELLLCYHALRDIEYIDSLR